MTKQIQSFAFSIFIGLSFSVAADVASADMKAVSRAAEGKDISVVDATHAVPQSCGSFGTAATISASCINCPIKTSSNLPNAIDGDVTTFASASLYHPDDTSSAVSQFSVQAQAQKGLTFPAGSVPGVIFAKPKGSTVTYNVTLNTYLGLLLQESVPVIVGHAGPSTDNTVFVGFSASSPTTKAFDSVELSIVETAPSLEMHEYRYYEFCSNSQ